MESQPIAVDIEEGIARISSKGSFEFNPAVRTGDNVEPQRILGVIWMPRTDKLSVKCDINVHGKVKGARVAPDVDLDILHKFGQETTKLCFN